MAITPQKAADITDVLLGLVDIAPALLGGKVARRNSDGVIANPDLYLKSLTAARDTLDKAIAIHKSVDWPDSTELAKLCAEVRERSRALSLPQPRKPNYAAPSIPAGETPWTVAFTRDEFRLCWLECLDAIQYALTVVGSDWLSCWYDGDPDAHDELTAWRHEGEPL